MSSRLFLEIVCMVLAFLFFMLETLGLSLCLVAAGQSKTGKKGIEFSLIAGLRKMRDLIREDRKENGKANRRSTNQRRLVDDAIAQAQLILEEADEDTSKMLQDSGIFYLSWLRALVYLGDSAIIMIAMLALLFNIFLGTNVGSWGLPKSVESILRAYVPLVEANRKRRLNGPKGAEHGHKGGRPRKENPSGVSVETPNVYGKGNAYENMSVCDNGTACVNESAEVPVTVKAWKSAGGLKKKIYMAVLSAFFFKNLQSPETQTEKFLLRYAAEDWSLKVRDDNTAMKEWIQHVNRWEVRDDPMNRFAASDLELWARLYEVAPDDMREPMLDKSIRFLSDENRVEIRCPKAVSQWIENNADKLSPILMPWLDGRQLGYSILKTSPHESNE